jgi:hypothetical protein
MADFQFDPNTTRGQAALRQAPNALGLAMASQLACQDAATIKADETFCKNEQL